jgi:stage III sporulation protein AB
MFIKIFICILLTATGTFIGFMYAGRLTKRKIAITELIQGLEILRSEIFYTHDRLDLIADRVSRISEGASAYFFKKFADDLHSYGEKGVSSVWNDTVQACFPSGDPLTAKDTDALRALGVRLGSTDVAGQCENIGRTVKELSIRLADARSMELQKGRLYRTLGVAGGLLFAVLAV